jgi:ATP-binding cassette subfamily B protein/subfamily B ATP-binding cassette protein MsbA
MGRFANIEAEKPRNRNRVIYRLLKLVVPYKWLLILSLGLVTISAASQGLSPYLIGRAIDGFITKGDAAGLARIIVVLMVVYIVGMFATRYQIIATNQIGQNLLAELRHEVFVKIQSLSLQFLESKQAGEIMSRLVNDIEALNSFFTQALAQMIGSIFSLAGLVVAMVAIDWQLALAVLVMVPVLLLTTTWFSKMARTAFRKTRTTIGEVSANLEEELSGVKVAQAFNRTDANVRRFASVNAANRDANVNAMAVTSAFMPAMDLLSTIDMGLVAALGGYLVISGRLSVGIVVAFLQYVQNFFRPIQTVAQMWTLAQSAFAAAERVFDLLDLEPTVQDAPDAIPAARIEGFVRFEDVSFSYEKDEMVLCRASFEAKPGQTIAIVGPTGAGKSTLVSLLARLYDVTSGRVLIDGKDVRSLQQRSLRSQMGIVTQEPFLFSGTVMENIRYGRLNATDEEVYDAAKTANAFEFISRASGGFNGEVGERGRLLSQGQRQLIAISRAVLADPRILILDEATASIDTQTEVLIQKALQKLLAGRTSFVIAHRLSTVRNADLVLVIDQGEIVERGTHKELMKMGGLYADLYNRQFYQPEADTRTGIPALFST